MLLWGRLSKRFSCCCKLLGFPVVLAVKNLPAYAGDLRDVGSISGSGRSPGGGHGSPLQYSCWVNPMDRGAWRAAVHGITKSRTWLTDVCVCVCVCVCESLRLHAHRRAVKSTNQAQAWLLIKLRWMGHESHCRGLGCTEPSASSYLRVTVMLWLEFSSYSPRACVRVLALPLPDGDWGMLLSFFASVSSSVK